MSYHSRDWQVFDDVLTNGPSIPRRICERTGCSQGAVKHVIKKLQRSQHLMIVGHAPRAVGQVGRLPYIIDIGPKVRVWAARNIKPPRDDE